MLVCVNVAVVGVPGLQSTEYDSRYRQYGHLRQTLGCTDGGRNMHT